MTRAIHLILVALTLLPCATFGQVTTGAPPFGSLGGGPFDTVNLANLNVHFAVPVLHKAGRGIPFTYDLGYDSSIYYPVSVSGVLTWQPVQNWGWHAQTEIATGYVSFSQDSIVCGRPVTGFRNVYSNFVYHDTFGTSHNFSGTAQLITGTCSGQSTRPLSTTATDSSGYILHYLVSTDPTSPVILPAGGGSFFPPIGGVSSGAGSATDANGNQISVNASGVFTDTLGTTAVTISGSGTPTSPVLLTYMPPSGTAVPIQVNYTTANIQTNFACGVAPYTATGVSLVSSITMPDGSSYSFTYEPNGSDTTGRLKQVTLPTGGTITYTYGGISCADGSVTQLTRTLSSGGQWTYTRTQISGNHWQTKVTSPPDPTVGDDTVIDFQKDSATNTTNNFYETQSVAYQGTAPTTPLSTTITCYNAPTGTTPTPSACPAASVSTPILRATTFNYLPTTSGVESETDSTFDAFGLIHEVDAYDYGAVGSGVGSVLRKISTSYATLGNGIVNRPSSVSILDGAGNVKALTNYSYDEGSTTGTSSTPQHTSIVGSRGNVTTVATQVNSGGSTLYRHFAYYDTGSLSTSTATGTSTVNGALTTYNYASGSPSCGNSFVTSITEPLSLSRSMTWDCNGGVMLGVTDENGKTASTSFSGSNYTNYFWRPYSTSDELGNITDFFYYLNSSNQPFQTESKLIFNSGNSVSDHLMTFDAFGRTIFNQTRQGPTASNYDTVGTCYDFAGRARFVSLPYSATAANSSMPCPSGPGGSTAYDAVGRITNRTDSGGGSTSFSYTENDTLQTLGPAPSGENSKSKQLENDGLGRLKSVCEISSTLPGVGACAQATSRTGYWTTYTYDLLGNITGVTQNAQATGQTRMYVYDSLGRMTSELNPESGITTYIYDSAPPSYCATSSAYSSPGNLVAKTDANGNNACYFYDAMGRLTDVGNNHQSVSNPCKRFRYDNSSGVLGVQPTGVHPSNSLGRMVEAETDTCASPITSASIITDEWSSYSGRGEITDVWESTPHSGAYYHPTQAYWANGGLQNLWISTLPSIAYSADGEGRTSAVNATSGQNPVTSTTYNALSQVTGVTFGSGDSDSYTYDPSTGRMTQYKSTVSGSSKVGNLGWNANGSLQTQGITDPFNVSDTQNCTYLHDDLQRVASASCGSVWSQTFTYDPFGNIKKSGSISWMPSYNTSTNRYASSGTSYDANGNLLNDTFHAYTWNVYGHPLTIDAISLTYDAMDRVVEQNQSGSNLEIVYTPSGAKMGLFNGATIQQLFVPLPGGATAEYLSWGLSHYRHSDWLGNNRLESSTAHSILDNNAYAPFGEPYVQTGNGEISFTGQNKDTVWLQYDFLARQYDPKQGRWISPDPSGMAAVNPTDPQSWNRYGYVNNQPLTGIDPTGLERLPINISDLNFGFLSMEEGLGDLEDCEQDNVDVPCALAFGALSSGGAVQCPNNQCTRVGSDGVQYFWASTNGPGSYYSYSGPGSLFYSLDQAGIAAVLSYEAQSIAQNREFSGVVYEDANEVFSFSDPTIGPVCTAWGTGACEVVSEVNNPPGTTYSASYHTHPNISGAENFSPTDIESDIRAGVSGFIGTPPFGRVMMFNFGLLQQFGVVGGTSPVCVLRGSSLGTRSCY